MTEPITIVRLQAFEGANIYGPHPAVRLLLRCDKDRSGRLRAAIKDGAQFVGLMLARLNVEATPQADHVPVLAHFITDAPLIAAELCRLLVAGIAAEIRGDDEWDGDTPLLTLQERRIAWALPAAALQVVAEAHSRSVPCLRLPDGRLLVGSGATGWILDPAQLRKEAPPAPPWERIAAVPLIAVSGERRRSAAVMEWSVRMAGSGRAVRVADDLDYRACVALLADPQAETLVFGLRTSSLLAHGLAFDRCDHAVITDCGGTRPAAAADDEEWLHALGLPLLVSRGTAYFGPDTRLDPLRAYAPHAVREM